MKNTIITLFAAFSLASCSVDKMLLSEEQKSEWKLVGDSIYRNNLPVAVYDHQEYEINPQHGKHVHAVLELSIRQFDNIPSNTVPLIRFIHTKHPKMKIEIVIPNNPNSNK